MNSVVGVRPCAMTGKPKMSSSRGGRSPAQSTTPATKVDRAPRPLAMFIHHYEACPTGRFAWHSDDVTDFKLRRAARSKGEQAVHVSLILPLTPSHYRAKAVVAVVALRDRIRS